MTYRDSFESCPRCGVALDDAGALRACSQCSGQWILEPVLSEMVLEMMPPGILRRVQLGTPDEGAQAIGCPSCHERMQPLTMLGVRFDRCAKGHGMWFDKAELETVLRIVGEGTFQDAPEPPPPPRPPAPPPPEPPKQRELVFQIATPGDVVREARSGAQIIKIGSLESCHVHIPNDKRVTRLHALVDIDGPPTLVDLGSAVGTYVNGNRINKHVLRSGDEIVIGATTLTVTFDF